MSSEYELTETAYGFRWGPLEVSRLISDARGGVLIEVKADGGQAVEIRVTPRGKTLSVTRKV